MALLAILSGGAGVISMDRGNVGVLTGVVAKSQNYLSLPTLGGTCDYPAQTDVRSGVAYSTFTGNLTLPVESNVLTGIQYGASGTEFTGTATAGGGGSEEIILNVSKGAFLKRMTDKLYFDL